MEQEIIAENKPSKKALEKEAKKYKKKVA